MNANANANANANVNVNRNGSDARDAVWGSISEATMRSPSLDEGAKLRARDQAFTNIAWPKRMKLLGESQKVKKGEGRGYATAVLYMAPGDTSRQYGGTELCPWRSPACGPLCLGQHSGRLAFDSSQNAQAWKSVLFVHCRQWFTRILLEDIRAHVKRAQTNGLIPVVRLNGSTDIPWERMLPELFAEFPEVQFYDYTKSQSRALDYAVRADRFPRNYHLTYSRSEQDSASRISALRAEGVSVAVVADCQETAERAFGGRVENGDETDLRFLDDPGSVVWLSPKGTPAKHDDTGFVLRELPVL